jgi:signal transduction histidine kinase
MNAQPESNTWLRDKWLLVARLAWTAVFTVLTVMYALGFLAVRDTLSTVCEEEPCTLYVQIRYTEAGEQVMEWGGPPIGFADPLRPDQLKALAKQGLTLRQYGWLGALQMGIPALVYLLIAAVLFWRKSDDWMVLFISTVVMTSPLVDMPLPYTLVVRQPIWEWVHTPASFLAASSWFTWPLVFPTGRFVPRWMRWKILFDIAFAVHGTLAHSSILPSLGDFGYIYVLLSICINVYALSYRYFRVASPAERQQIKWVFVGLMGFISIAFVSLQFDFQLMSQARGMDPARALILSVIPDTLYRAVALFVPVSIALSVLRYRLWDIDIIINRTLVYGALTGGVVALYVLIVGWSSIGLQTQSNLAGSIFAILVIAFLFQPLRQRLQHIADRFVPVPQTALPAEQHKHQIAIPESQSTTGTRLRGRWLLIARLAWVAVFTVLTIMYTLSFVEVREALSTVCEEELCSLDLQIQHSGVGERVMNFQGSPVGFAERLRPPQVEALVTLGLTLDRYGWLGALQMGIPALLFLLIAAGLFWRKSDNWMALFVSIMVATTPLWAMPLPFTLAVRQPAWAPAVGVAFFISQSFNLTFPLIFPSGQFVPRWTRWVLLVALVHAAFWSFYRPLVDYPRADEFIPVTIVIIGFISLYAQVYRYFRVAGPLERQQLKWIVVGYTGLLCTALLVVNPLNELLISKAGIMDPAQVLVLSAIIDTLSLATTLFSPVAIVIAVLRYRLWDIDIIINRTLVYGALTGIVGSAFVILVGFLSILFQSSGNSIVTIIATGLVALMFNPLRQRLQRSVNHLMYGERDEPYTALSRLGRRLETTLAPESVLPTVVTTVRDVLRLPYVAIYLQQDSQGYKIVAESASPQLRTENGRLLVPGMEREGRCIPLIHQGETVGYIVLGPRAPNEAFSSTDLRLLDDLAPQVGVAVHAVRLTADLQRSREQLVLAREEERRRLRRDLHDGLGPQLAGLALKLETLRNRLNGDPLADSILADLAKRTQDATADIRHLVYELRPPTLDEFGLVMALREGVAQFSQQGYNGLNITFDAPESLPPLPAAVEVAVYRITQEALTNVIRHADASSCLVRLSLDESAGLLCLEVQDDGKGLLLKRRAGVGLNSMRERAEELGGSFTITSLPTGGTHLTAELPCRVSD